MTTTDDGGGDARADVHSDTPTDRGGDTGTDVLMQTDATDVQKVEDVQTPDSGEDVVTPTDVQPVDTGVDAEVDTGTDAEVDTGTDVVAPMDVQPVDSGTDAGTDVGTDTFVPPTCAYPVAGALVSGTPVMGTIAATTGNNVTATTCQADVPGGEAIYSLHLTAPTTVHLQTAGTLDTVVSIRSMCDVATSEVACNDDDGPSLLSSITQMLPAGDYFVIVDQYSGGTPSGGMFTLYYDAVTPVANGTCATAATLTPGTPVMGNTINGGARSSGCVTANDGNETFYSLTIPANSAATVTMTPGTTGTYAPELRLLDTCAATTCLANSAGTLTTAATSRFTNSSGSPRTIFVSAGSTNLEETGPYTLSATVGAIPNVCTGATAIANGTMLTGQDLSTATIAVDSYTSCGTGPGGNLFYTATVPANSTLSVVVAPTGFDAVVRLIDACTPGACLNRVDGGGVSGSETISVHAGSTPQNVVIAVGSYDTTLGTFSLNATVAADPYTISTGTAMCDDMTTAPVLAGVASDTSVSAIAPLPIAFNFFGVAQMGFTVASNGFMQLFPTTTGTGSSTTTNANIPATGTPNNYLAPFWDDLTVAPSPEVTDVRTLNVTTGTPHFTVQWTNWTVFSATSIRLTIQAQLYPTTNRIEYHYCTVTPGTSAARAAGSSATVGLENSGGTAGVLYEFNGLPAANTVTQGTSLIFTAVP